MGGKREDRFWACGGPGVPLPTSCITGLTAVEGGLPEALNTFGCPAPLWRQRLPKKVPQTRNSSRISQSPGDVGKRQSRADHGEEEERWEKGERKVTNCAQDREKQSRIVPTGFPGPRVRLCTWEWYTVVTAGLGSYWAEPCTSFPPPVLGSQPK